MTAPRTTPNPATRTHPERSSRRVAHKRHLAWLPWAALLALAALLGLIALVVHAVDDDGTKAATGSAVGKASSSNGSGATGSDGAVASTGPSVAGVAPSSAASAPSAEASPAQASPAQPGQAAAGTAAALKVGREDLLGLAGGSLASRVGRPVSGSARVESVVADEGFWVGPSKAERTFVHLSPRARGANGESPFQVKAGQTVELTGRLVSPRTAPRAIRGVTAAEGRSQLRQQGAFVDVEAIHLAG